MDSPIHSSYARFLSSFLGAFGKTLLLVIAGFAAVFIMSASAHAASFYVAPDGNDSNPGTLEAPFKSLMKAQTAASEGDVVYIRGGIYDTFDIAATDSNYNYVHRMSKSNITYEAYEDEKPVFDFSSVEPVKRVAAFHVPVGTSNVTFRGIEVIGVKAGTQKQSECFRIQGNAHFDRVSAHDTEANGFYFTTQGSGSLINCDAYNNIGPTSASIGNTDGFGFHANPVTVKNCRSWHNSDDGYDTISSQGSITFENSWAYDMTAGGDSNGFKVGGGTWGNKLPNPVPVHIVKNCISANNNASGFYANHHLGQAAIWTYNTAFNNKTANFNMLERTVLEDLHSDIDGYREELHYNIAFSGKDIMNANLPPERESFNSWTMDVAVSEEDFQSLDASQLTLPRKADGSLPDITFMKLASESDLAGLGYGYTDGVVLADQDIELAAGASAQLEAAVFPLDAQDKTVTFTSSDAHVATVTDAVYNPVTGKTSVTVTAVAPGIAVITAAAAEGGTSATSLVTVSAAPVETVEMSLSQFHAATGESIIVSGSTAANTDVLVRAVQADGTDIYSATVTSNTYGEFSTTITVPSDMSPGILYVSAAKGSLKASANLSVYAADSGYTPPVVIEDDTPVTVTDTHKTVAVTQATYDHTSSPVSISVPSTVSGSALSVAQLLYEPSDSTVTTAPLPGVKVTAAATIGSAAVTLEAELPRGLIITAPAAWNGMISLPAVLANNTVTPVPDPGYTATVHAVIETGSPDVPLTFNKAVRLVIPGMGGKKAGYQSGTVFTKVTQVLSADTQTAADAEIAAGGDAYITVGADLVIWTKHFTKFAAYAQTAISSDSDSDSDSSGSSGGGITPSPSTPAPTPTPSTTPGAATPAPSVALTDIAGHWAHAEIDKLIHSGAVAGYPDRTFKPDQSITRAEFVKILVAAFKLEAKAGQLFSDTANHWAKDYIATANAHGIVDGYSDSLFGPDDLITREQMAVMAVKAAKLPLVSGEAPFSDQAEISSWAAHEVFTARKDGIINGYPDGSFKPKGNATRAEAISIIAKALK
jgi:hypothetical protein